LYSTDGESGIHNEPGVLRESVPALPITIGNIFKYLNPGTRLPTHRQVALMINNLGGLSVLELHVIAEEVIRQVGDLNLDVRRILIGTFVTSLDGPGFSVTILGLEDGMEELLNAPTIAPAWPNIISSVSCNGSEIEPEIYLNGASKSYMKETLPGKCYKGINH
jgi:dihydroxyacetone kinase